MIKLVLLFSTLVLLCSTTAQTTYTVQDLKDAKCQERCDHRTYQLGWSTAKGCRCADDFNEDVVLIALPSNLRGRAVITSTPVTWER